MNYVLTIIKNANQNRWDKTQLKANRVTIGKKNKQINKWGCIWRLSVEQRYSLFHDESNGLH